MDQAFITAPCYPPATLLTGIIVNREGRRFVAEDSYHSRTSGFVLEQPGSAAFLIVDSAHLAYPELPLVPFIDGWESVAEMEAGLGIPAGNLVATLARYNADAAAGEDREFRKHPDWLAPQDQGPWGAFDLTLGKAMYAGFTLGGLRCTVDGQVQRADGTIVRRPVRRRRVRVQHRAGRQGLQQRNAARRGVVLRPPGRPARGPAARRCLALARVGRR